MFIPGPTPAVQRKCGQSILAKNRKIYLGVGVFGDPGLAQAVKKDPLGIGFNNIGYAYDATTKETGKGAQGNSPRFEQQWQN